MHDAPAHIFPLLAILLLLMAGAAGGGGGAAPVEPSPRPSVERVENGGLLFTDNSAGVSGTDAGYSVPLGRQTLWLFGDVFLLHPYDPAKPYVGAVSNCGLLVPAGKGAAPLRRYRFLTDPETGVARHVLPPPPGDDPKARYWPFGGWYSPSEKRVYLYYGRIRVTGGGPLDFTLDGHGLASADASDPERIRFSPVPASPRQTLWWPHGSGAPIFGNAVVSGARGDFLYVVGVEEREGRKQGKLARVRKAGIENPGAYEYYAGGGPSPRWSRDPREAADVEGLADFPSELSVSYNAYLGGYLAVHTVGLTEKVRLSLAPRPWGPYTPIGEIGAPRRAFSRGFCYAGKEHPELAEAGGRVVYLTYVDSERYWLQLLKVTLRK